MTRNNFKEYHWPIILFNTESAFLTSFSLLELVVADGLVCYCPTQIENWKILIDILDSIFLKKIIFDISIKRLRFTKAFLVRGKMQ